MSKIYDLPLSYRLTKNYIVPTFKHFYDEYIVLGKENIPAEGPVIFAPNHLNALMDALAVVSITPDHYSTVFLARADMFGKKIVADFLRFAKLIPAFRVRDGIENLGKNAETFDKCVEVLESNNALGIMPEGNQELERKIRPLVKGIFRIAFSAQQKIGTAKNVKIIPIGIDMGDLFKFGKHIIINIGKPIDVSEYMPEYAENPVAATNKIRNTLKNSLENLVINLNTKQYYRCFETATQLTNISMLEKMKFENNTLNRFYARQEIGKRLVAIERETPAKAAELNTLCSDFENLRAELNLHIKNFDTKPRKTILNILSGLGLILLSPVFLIGFLLNFFPFFTPVFIRKMMKVKFEGFFTSLHYGIGIFSFPIFYLLQAILFFSFTGFSWWLIWLFIPVEYFSGKWAFRLYKRFRKFVGRINHSLVMRNKPELYNKALVIRNSIINIVLNSKKATR